MKGDYNVVQDKKSKFGFLFVILLLCAWVCFFNIVTQYKAEKETKQAAESQVLVWESMYNEYSEFTPEVRVRAMYALLTVIESSTCRYDFSETQLERIEQIKEQIDIIIRTDNATQNDDTQSEYNISPSDQIHG